MTLAEFEKLVLEALDQILDEISDRLDNVDVVVEDWPTSEQMAGSGIEDGHYLLGLYEGIPLTDRYGYDMVLPDKITLFQKPIEAICASDEEIVGEVRATVVHEVAHHFGIDDASLEQMGV
jgi:predicted Zn-dependent protease with MMP-like domain